MIGLLQGPSSWPLQQAQIYLHCCLTTIHENHAGSGKAVQYWKRTAEQSWLCR